MAVVSGRIQGRSDVSARLQAAICDFRDSLHDDEQRLLQSTSGVPTADQVVAFARLLDENKTSKWARDIGPRVQSFLNATQQFSDVLDTFSGVMGGTGTLVWGTVKLSLLLLNNVSSYRDQVSEIVMRIGRKSPVFSSYGRLYSSTLVQEALCGYYLVVVQLFTAILAASRRNAMWQTISSALRPAKTEFDHFVTDLENSSMKLEDICRYISDEQQQSISTKVDLLSSGWQANRRVDLKEQSAARDWRLQHQSIKRASLQKDIEGMLSQIDTHKSLYHILDQRTPGTAQWFQQDPVLQDFVRDATSGVFWCRGNMGCGKTVLLASIIEHLHTVKPKNALICWHFCDTEHQSSLSARCVLGHLACQLLKPYLDKAPLGQLAELANEVQHVEPERLVELLIPRMWNSGIVFLIIDGLDQCEVRQQSILLQALKSLTNSSAHGLKIMIGAQPEVGNIISGTLGNPEVLLVDQTKNRKDIEEFAKISLSHRIDRGDVRFRDVNIESEILETIKTGAEGMFLWAKLFLEEVCAQVTDDDIRKCLSTPPKRIVDLVNNLLHRIQRSDQPRLALKLLLYCGSLKSPITMAQYEELLSLERGQDCLDSTKMVNNVDRVVGRTLGLAYIDESPETIHIIHHSIQKHLLTPEGLGVRANAASWDLGILAVTYLNFSDHKQQMSLARNAKGMPVNAGAMMGVLSVSRGLPPAVQNVSTLLVSRRSRKIANIATNSQSLSQHLGPKRTYTPVFPFMQYAREHWLWHFQGYSDLLLVGDRRLVQHMRACMQDTTLSIAKPWLDASSVSRVHDTTSGAEEVRVFDWFYENDLPSLAFVQVEISSTKLLKPAMERLVQISAREGWHNVLVALLRKSTRQRRENLELAMKVCCRAGDTRGVETLIGAFNELQSSDKDAGAILTMALTLAAIMGHEAILDMLVQMLPYRPYFNVDNAAVIGAAAQGHLAILRTLLRCGGLPDATDNYGWSPLQAASSRGHVEIVRELVVAGAEVNTFYKGSTPLHTAATKDHSDIFEVLLDNGARLEGIDPGVKTLLDDARGGNAGAVQRAMAAVAALDGRSLRKSAADRIPRPT